MITESPNSDALKLKINDLYLVNKNPFCQFFGRPIFGNEKLFLKYFKIENIKWMHAKGSSCYRNKYDDGEEAIIKSINQNDYKLVITFGRPALKIIIPNFDNFNKLFNSKRTLNKLFNDKITKNNFELVPFPHPSGRAQSIWMNNYKYLSENLLKVQSRVQDILKMDMG